MRNDMERFEVKPLQEPKSICVKVPGSKSMTNRALLMAAMGEGNTVLQGVQFSEDSRVFLTALQELGFSVYVDEEACTVRLQGCGGEIPRKNASIYVGSAGTAARFLTAFTAMSQGVCRVEASEQMAKRPMKELLVALESLGARFVWLQNPYQFPMEIHGMGRKHGAYTLHMNIDESSQFLSAILMTAPLVVDQLTIHLTGERKARSYVNMTERMMRSFGHPGVQRLGENSYQVGKHTYQARTYRIEPDVSAACYFYAAAAITGGSAIVPYVEENSLQGDMRFLEVLEQMGCKRQMLYLEQEKRYELQLTGPKEGKLKGIDVNMADFSDQALTLAAIAPFTDAPVTIRGVGHIRGQESDRLQVICTELGRLGIQCHMEEDGVIIYPGDIKGTAIETYEDHRVAMAFAVTGLKIPGIVIKNPMCCKKTFAEYFQVFSEVFDQ